MGRSAGDIDDRDPLRLHFSGKRIHARVPCDRPVRLRGAEGTWEGALLDVARSGALAVLTSPGFYVPDADGLAQVERSFAGGVEVGLEAEGFSVRGRVVRMLPRDDGRLALGIAMDRAMDDVEALLLGVPPESIADPEATVPALPLAARPGAALSLLLFARHDGLAGPLWGGVVTSLGTRAIEAVGPAAGGARALSRSLASVGVVEGALHAGRHARWRGPVTPVACRVGTPDPDRVRVRVLAFEPFPGRVRRAFRRPA